jgi:hypothetical protein
MLHIPEVAKLAQMIRNSGCQLRCQVKKNPSKKIRQFGSPIRRKKSEKAPIQCKNIFTFGGLLMEVALRIYVNFKLIISPKFQHAEQLCQKCKVEGGSLAF